MPGILFTILQDFTAIPDIGQSHKGLGPKSCHFLLFFITFAWACVHMVWCRVRRLVYPFNNATKQNSLYYCVSTTKKILQIKKNGVLLIQERYVCVRRRTARFNAWQRRQEEAHTADLFRPTNLRLGKDLRANQVPCWPWTGETCLRTGDDREPSQGKSITFAVQGNCIL